MSCCQWRIAGEGGIRFFGRMSASISHEIKNVLAIVNENAGLLEDMTLLADRGIPMDPERLKRISQAVTGQVRRADAIIRNMNRFAHSTDESVSSVDLEEILDLVLALANRLAVNRGINLERVPAADSVSVTTSPFQLENLIWLCLDFAMEVAGPGKTISLAARKAPDGNRIEFFEPEGLLVKELGAFPGDREKALLEILRAEFALNREDKHFAIILPNDISV